MARWQMQQGLRTVSIVLLGTLSACTWLNRPVPYADAQQSAPLVVPDGMAVPPANPALNVPDVRQGGLLDEAQQAPPKMGTPAASASAGAATADSAALNLSDDADSAFRRVGLALERSGCCDIVDRNPRARSYLIELKGEDQPGLLRRWFSSAERKRLQVIVDAEGAQSRVRVTSETGVELDDERARSVKTALADRLR